MRLATSQLGEHSVQNIVGVGAFVPASRADNAGTGPYRFGDADSGLDASGVPLA